MKYLLTPVLLFLVWKLWRDWQRLQDLKARRAKREAAVAEFEQFMFTLECKQANGQIDEALFKRLRAEAEQRLAQVLKTHR